MIPNNDAKERITNDNNNNWINIIYDNDNKLNKQNN